jgi:hypothetical protein
MCSRVLREGVYYCGIFQTKCDERAHAQWAVWRLVAQQAARFFRAPEEHASLKHVCRVCQNVCRVCQTSTASVKVFVTPPDVV